MKNDQEINIKFLSKISYPFINSLYRNDGQTIFELNFKTVTRLK